jgi:hypothetical protein
MWSSSRVYGKLLVVNFRKRSPKNLRFLGNWRRGLNKGSGRDCQEEGENGDMIELGLRLRVRWRQKGEDGFGCCGRDAGKVLRWAE